MKRAAYIALFCFCILSAFAISSSFALADTTSTSVTVDAVVSSGATCGNGVVEGAESCDAGGSNGICPASCSLSCTTNTCGGGGGGDDGDTTSPAISNITQAVGATTSSISWNASDNVGVSSCSFAYGLTLSYGSSGSVGGAYSVSLTGLTGSTQYFYRIQCSDGANNSTDAAGSFTTRSVIGDTTGPTITLISTTSAQTTASVQWTASDVSGVGSCSLSYGVAPALSSSATVVGTYQSSLSSLVPNTAYACQISCLDTIGNSTSITCPFQTTADITPPPDVSGFVAVGVNAANNLSWNYSDSISDFSHYRIEWALGSCPARGSGSALPSITAMVQHTASHTGLTNSTTYHYRLSVFDTSGNASAGVCAFATPVADIIAPVCGNNVIEDGEVCDGTALAGATCVSRGFDGGSLSCSSCSFNTADCTYAPAACGNGVVDAGEQCDDGNSNAHDGCTNLCQAAVCGDSIIRDGLEQCDGSDLGGASCTTLGYASGSLSCSSGCTYNASACVGGTPIGGGVEECTNTIDDDADGLIDCADTDDCVTHPSCTGVYACSDSIDNDGDGMTDLSDVGCSSATDNDEYNAPEVTVPSDARVSSLLYWIAERTIAVTPVDGVVKSMIGDQLTVGVLESDLYQVTPTTRLTLVVLGNRYELVRSADAMYRADVVMPPVGTYDAVVEIEYGSGLTDAVSFRIQSTPYGVIFGEHDTRLSGAIISLLDSEGNSFDSSLFRQPNPYTTSDAGTYGFVVPNGRYVLLVTKEGYAEYKTYSFQITDHVINRSATLLKLPETPAEAIAFVAALSTQVVAGTVEKINDVANDPVVEEVTADVIAPALATVATVSIAPSLLSILLPLVRFLFLQPLLLFGRKKRQAWGVVYNSLNKLPIDLATVRLIDKKTGRVVQSRVTDSKGRYLFMVEPGNYAIEVFKQGFVFPSKLLSSVTEDGSFLDVYHGENVSVEHLDAHITPNIPVDPTDAKEKSVRRIIAEKWLRRTQHIVSVTGIIGAIISIYIYPSGITISLLCVHVLVYVGFIRYVRPKQPKGWGLVYQAGAAQQPVGRVVARLFSKQFDKLVATQVTDSKGRYSFLVGPNEYYVTFEKEGYVRHTTDAVSIKDEAGLVIQDVSLTKDGATSNDDGPKPPHVSASPEQNPSE